MAKNPHKKNSSNKQFLASDETKTDPEVLGSSMPVPPLIDGESEADYHAFRESCLRAVRPKDAIEKIWLQDFIDYSWEATRFRRMKVALIQATRREAVERLVKDCLGSDLLTWDAAKSLAQGWSSSNEDSVAEVNALIEQHGHNFDTVLAMAVSLKLKDLERIDRLIASYDYRRDAAIRELEKRRDLLAKRAREIADAKITDIKVEKLEAAE